MSAMGISRPRVICAHADYRRADFIFSRTQSDSLRMVPWGNRIKPMRSWAEIYGYAAAAAVGTALLTAFI
jgi:hypothetical protein